MTREHERRRRDEVLEDEDGSANRLPPFVSTCSNMWRDALPPNVPPMHATGILAHRAAALLAGTAIPTRSEAAALDHALGTDTVRYMPPVQSATLTDQRAPEPSTVPRLDPETAISAWLRRKRRATKAAKSRGPAIALVQN